MSNVARIRRVAATGIAAVAAVSMIAGCSSGAPADSNGKVTIELAQWWEPELPDGAFQGLIDEFEKENPNITVKLLSGPYASTKEQLFAGSAAGTMSDVVGLDGAWVSDFAKQGSLADLTQLFKDYDYDDSKLASQVKIDGSTYMIPVVNFVYPMFSNDDLLAQAGVSTPPTTRTEFADAAKAVSDLGGDTSGWVLPLSSEAPNGIQNDVMSWVWASGGSMLKKGKPDVTNKDVTSAVEFIKGMWDDGSIAPGSFTQKEQDKVEEFTNGRVGLMIDSLAHINLIRQNNPDLKFSISALPAVDGYDGPRGIPYASWGIGVSESSKHKEEAFKLVEFLMSKKTNSELSTLANAFPGNTDSTPDFSDSDPLFEQAFEIYKAGTPANEFVGLPVSEDLMRQFDEQFQKLLSGDQNVKTTLESTQKSWEQEF
ncbi:sugar ABC transporter substrate-binding protein [Schumannella sp. 10F1B-5-1]|uniref:ABC transporter substrate-binding protein n=1 Tax=Schumannella sp. 10F1B-5-1 TaxID=2590780 RepID=UPI00112FD5F6|nr:sugar ABC transporter substrate-binding protein [Schumannella sp. 10F1B-5-1]TPW70207.1 sugar ABC transporter substrate-binding protein [Schumannella sp. 10F1B-5-1]